MVYREVECTCICSVDSRLLSFAMADVASDQARREARRKRILENSENRLQRITGKYKEKNSEEKPNLNNDVSYLLPKADDSISSKILASESRSILEEKHLNFLEQDKSFDIKDYELDDLNPTFQKPDDLFASDYPIRQSSKTSRETFDSFNSNPVNSQQNLNTRKPKDSFLFTILYSPICSILLAAFMNILLLANVNFSIYESLIVPYLIIAITRICFEYKAKQSQESSMLVAALILCNIKPEIVHTLKKVLKLFNTFSQGFALYVTSFTIINWVISIFWNNANTLTFF